MPAHEPRRSTAVSLALILALWTAFGILSAGQIYVRETTDGRASSWYSVFNIVYFYWAWAIVTPLVLRLARAMRPRWQSMAIFAPGAVALIAVQSGVYAVFQIVDRHGESRRFADILYLAFIRHFAGNLLTLVVIVAAYGAFQYYRAAERRELEGARTALRASELEATLSRVRLDALMSQLRPHFLFNTLNMIASLIAKQDDVTATRVVARLGDLLRETFSASEEHEATLEHELRFTRHYLEIARLRLGSGLRVSEQIDDGALECLVPRFILQPLVENAVVHGAANGERVTDVEIRADRAGANLLLQVRDRGPGFADAVLAQGGGLGLSIVRERLRQLYGDRAGVACGNATDGGAFVTLRLPAVSAPTGEWGSVAAPHAAP